MLAGRHRDQPDLAREPRATATSITISPDIAARIIGVTPLWKEIQDEFSMGTYVRRAEIEGWLRQTGRAWEAWLVLDDRPYLFRPFIPNLVRCDPAIELSEDVCQIFHQKLLGV